MVEIFIVSLCIRLPETRCVYEKPLFSSSRLLFIVFTLIWNTKINVLVIWHQGYEKTLGNLWKNQNILTEHDLLSHGYTDLLNDSPVRIVGKWFILSKINQWNHLVHIWRYVLVCSKTFSIKAADFHCFSFRLGNKRIYENFCLLFCDIQFFAS